MTEHRRIMELEDAIERHRERLYGRIGRVVGWSHESADEMLYRALWGIEQKIAEAREKYPQGAIQHRVDDVPQPWIAARSPVPSQLGAGYLPLDASDSDDSIVHRIKSGTWDG